MANPTQLKGFKPLSNMVSASFNGQLTPYKIASGYAANIGAGDFVMLSNSGQVVIATASGRVLGIAVGVSYVGVDGVPVVKPNWVSGTVTFAAQDATVLVADDPNLLVEARFSGAVTVPQSSVGNTFPILVAAPDAMGNSQAGADSTSLTLTTNQPLRLIALSTKTGNDTASPNGLGVFSIMNHEYRATTGV